MLPADAISKRYYGKYCQELYKKAASGNPGYQCDLAECYYYGQGIEADASKAVFWWNKAALSKDKYYSKEAQYHLGCAYRDGIGVEKVDSQLSIFWLTKAADEYKYKCGPSSNAIIALGNIYYWGTFGEVDYTKAYKWYMMVPDEQEAQVRLGDIYYNGHGQKQDYRKAIELYQMKNPFYGTDYLDDYAKNMIGECYLFGHGVKKDTTEALKWFHKASENNDGVGAYMCGEVYYKKKDYSTAINYYLKADKVGSDYVKSIADYSLGYMYYSGDNPHYKKKYADAIKWWKKASSHGDADAMTQIGYMYEKGLGVLQNYDSCYAYSKKAAELGNAIAMSNLGECYQEGKGVAKDMGKAYEWYRKSMDLNCGYAIGKIGKLYYYGEYFPVDFNKAFEYLKRSAEDKDYPSGEIMRLLSACYRYGKGTAIDLTKAAFWMEQAALHDDEDAIFLTGLR